MKKVAILAGAILLVLLTLFALKEEPDFTGEAEPPLPVRTPAATMLPAATPTQAGPGPESSTKLPELTVSPTPTVSVVATPAPVVPTPSIPVPVVSPVAPTPEVSQPSRPRDAVVLDAYLKAEEAYAWFERVPLPMAEERVELDGTTYSRVDYPGIASMSDLRFYLKSLFSDEIVDGLLTRNTPRYTDIDGVLYGVDGGRGGDITKGGETNEVLWESDQRCQVQITVQILDPEQEFAVTGTEIHRFPYEKVGDKWIFTNFYLFR